MKPKCFNRNAIKRVVHSSIWTPKEDLIGLDAIKSEQKNIPKMNNETRRSTFTSKRSTKTSLKQRINANVLVQDGDEKIQMNWSNRYLL